MPDLDLVIRNGTVVTAADRFGCDVGVRGGRIVALAEGLPRAPQEIDATGRLVLPGGVDSHCHIEQLSGMGIWNADDFYSGTVAAAFGGTTTVIPFAAQHHGQSMREVVADYRERAKKGRGRPRLPHDRVRSDRDRAEPRTAGADPGWLLLAQAVHDLSPAASGRRPDARPPGACPARARDGFGPRRERRDARLDRAPPARARPSRAEIPRDQPSAPGRGRGGEPPDRHGRPGRSADRRVPRHDRRIDARDPRRPDRAVRRCSPRPARSTCCWAPPTSTGRGSKGRSGCSARRRGDAADRAAIWRGVQNGTFQMVTSDHAPYRFDESGKLAKGPTPTSSRSRTAFPGSSCACRCCSPKACARAGSTSSASSRSAAPTRPGSTACIRRRARSRSGPTPISRSGIRKGRSRSRMRPPTTPPAIAPMRA